MVSSYPKMGLKNNIPSLKNPEMFVYWRGK